MDVAPCPQGARPAPETALDLKGEYQAKNLRTVLAALDLLGIEPDWDALAHTAARTGLRGRWETLCDKPLTLCDIGHNPPALRENFAQLRGMMGSGRYDRLLIVYGIMADKALDDIIPLMPRDAEYFFATPDTPRARPAESVAEHFLKSVAAAGRPAGTEAYSAAADKLSAKQMKQDARMDVASCPQACQPTVHICGSVAEAIAEAQKSATENSLIYIGGSTFVVCEAITYYEKQ